MDDSQLRILTPDGACGGQPARSLPPADVNIGVVYTYERQFMPRLASSLALSGEGLRLRLILVDNASPDGAGQWRRHFPDTVVVRNPHRLHYAANLNRVLAVATSPYVLLLNTDMYFDPEEQCVAKMVRFMEAHPDCGIAGCRLLRADGSRALPRGVFRRCRRLLPTAWDRGGCFAAPSTGTSMPNMMPPRRGRATGSRAVSS